MLQEIGSEERKMSVDFLYKKIKNRQKKSQALEPTFSKLDIRKWIANNRIIIITRTAKNMDSTV